MPDDARRIALERIRILFSLAEHEERVHPKRAQRHTDLARRIASRNRVHLPPDLKRSVCPACKSFIGSSTSRIRIRQEREPHVTITCFRCGHITRLPLRSRRT